MIIYCDSSGNVSSIPSTVPFGAILDDVTIIAPKTTAMAMLKIKPPSGKLLEPIFCSKDFTFDKERDIVYKAIFPPDVTNKSGRAEYQIVFTMQDGKQQPTFAGSFNVARGVEVDLPETGDDLGAHSLDDILRMLTNATALYENVNNLQIDLEKVSKTVGSDDEIHLPNVFENVLDGLYKIDDTIGRAKLQTLAQNLSQAINELLGRIIDIQKEIGSDTSQLPYPYGSIYDALTGLYNQVYNINDAIGFDKDTLNPKYDCIFDAVNTLTQKADDLTVDMEKVSKTVGLDDGIPLPDVFDNVIDGLVKIYTLIGQERLQTNARTIIQAINEVRELAIECKERLEEYYVNTLTKHARDIESIIARLEKLEGKT